MAAPASPAPQQIDAAALSPTADDRRRHVPSARDFIADDRRGNGAPLLEALAAAPLRPHRQGLPPLAAPLFQACAVLTLVAIALALCGHGLGAPAAAVRLFDNLHWTLSSLGAAALAWLGVADARARALAAEFVARRWFAIGFSSYALGQALWDLQAALAWRPFPAPSDLFYLALAPCCAIGLMSTLRGRVSSATRFAAVLDTLALAIAVVAVTLVAYLPRSGDITPLALGLMVAYPTLMLATACVALMLVALLRVGRGWSVWTLTAMLAVDGALWMHWNALAMQGETADGSPFNALFSLCNLAGGLAASCWIVRSSPGARLERFYEGALRVLPLLVVIGVTFAVTLQDSIARLSPSARVACGAAALLVIVLAAVRQTLQLRDRDQLIEAQHLLREREAQLSELNQHLEQRVSARTHEAEQRNAELSQALQRLAMAQHELVRAEKLAGLGALVTGVAAEITAALANANMVALTLPAQVDVLARLQSPTGDESQRSAADERRRRQLAGYVGALGQGHRQLADSLDQAQRVIACFQQLAVDQTSDQRRGFDLLATVREVVDIIRLGHHHAPIEIVVTGEPGLTLDSYPGPIGQVLGQLIDNAVVHGFARSGEGLIEVRVWPSGHEQVRITVHDDGVGIAPADLPQVFAPFFTTRLAQGGSGLGLTICRNMVHGLLGGRIEIASPPDAGTTVTITLPRIAPRDAR